MSQQGFAQVIVDDGSTDDTCRILERYREQCGDRIRIIHYSTNKGKNYALNRGVENVDDCFVLFLDSDDFLLDGASESVRRYIAERPGYFHYMFMPDDRSSLPLRNRLLSQKTNEVTFADWLSERVSGDFVHVIHTDVLKRFPFFEEFRLYEGINFLRFFKFTQKQLIVNEVVVGRERGRKDALTREASLYRTAAIENEYRALQLRLRLFKDDYVELSPVKYDQISKRCIVLGIALSKYRELKENYEKFDSTLRAVYKLRLGVVLKALIRLYSLGKASLRRLSQ